MVGVLKRLAGIFLGNQAADRGAVAIDKGQTSIPWEESTATVVDHGENWQPKCRVCGSMNLRPDPGGYYYDAESRFGLPLCCVDHGQ
jgi:hypothetical protein